MLGKEEITVRGVGLPSTYCLSGYSKTHSSLLGSGEPFRCEKR